MSQDETRHDGTTENAGPGRVPGRTDRPSATGRRGDGPASAWLLAGLLSVLLLAGAVGLYLGLSGGDGGPTADAPGAGGGPGTEGPLSVPAAVVDFPTLDGDTASLEEYRGRVVLLNLWGTWCPPCRHEIPELVELQERIEPRGGVVIGLAVDSGSPASIRDFAEEFGINYPIWYGRGQEVIGHYRAIGYPTTLLIDPRGVIRRRYLGPQTAESLMRDVEPLLPEG